MPTEVRRIVFSHSESTTAILAYGERYNMTFPNGRIIRAAYTGAAEYDAHSMRQFQSPLHSQYNVEKKPRAVIITFFDEKTLEHKFINLTADFISGALIDYCLNHKIIIPKTALKSLDVTEFNLCLDIHMEQFTEPGAAPLALDE